MVLTESEKKIAAVAQELAADSFIYGTKCLELSYEYNDHNKDIFKENAIYFQRALAMQSSMARAWMNIGV